MPWYFLVLFLRHNSPEHIENILDTIMENYKDLSPRVLLVIVDHFTKLGDTDRALELLSHIPPEQREEHKVRILERCANLISIDTIDESDSVANFRALPRLVGLGLPMDFKVHNRILERALELGRPEVAWEVFRFMEARGICVEANGYLMLLKNSFEQSDREKLDTMMSSIHRREDLYQYPYLVTYMMNIVRVVCTIDRKLSPETSVSHLLAIYDRAYDRAPLVKLGIVNALPPQHTLRKRLDQPPPAVLGFTIWAYVLCQRDERIVSALWFWIMHMIKQQDESILACAKHDVMWNGFIHFYARSRFFLRKAVYVVEAMIEHNLCMPTERTWSEVLCGFMKHGEEETAAKIWHMMLARDVHPTEKGWAFLLENYDQTRLADLVKDGIDERQMPEGMDTALGWPAGTTAIENAPTEAKVAQQASQDDGQAVNENEADDPNPVLPAVRVVCT
jgi:pentatricopeptide repeat protein